MKGLTLSPESAVRQRRVIAASRAGVETTTVPQRVADALAAAMPFANLCWGAFDPTTLLPISNASLRPDPRGMTTVWEGEFLIPDVNKFAYLARAPSPVGVLSVATHGEPERSPRYQRVVRRLGYAHELRAALRLNSTCWGYLSLFRERQQPDFSTTETAFIASVVPHLAAALRSAQLRASDSSDAALASPGIIILDHENAVEAVNAEAARLLAEFGDATRVGARLPEAIYAVAVAARARAIAAGGDSTPAQARLRIPSGRWLVLEGSLLLPASGASRCAVTVQPAQPSQLAPLLLQRYELTEREEEVALCILRGLSTVAIAGELCVTPYTVQDHLKAIFDKAGVRSRRDLIDEVLFKQRVLRASKAPG